MKAVVTFLNCADNRITAPYVLNALNNLSDLTMLTKRPEDDTTYDLQLMIEYPGCYEHVPEFLKFRLAPKKVFYSIDPHLTFDTVKDYYHKYDLDMVYTTQKSFVKKFKENKVKCEWLPNAAHPMHFSTDRIRPGKIKPVYDVAYVGTLNDTEHQTKRRELLEAIYKKFNVNPIHLAIPEEICLVYKTAKIGFNRSVLGDLNMRTFEIMASGRLLLTDYQDGIYDLFKSGKHLSVYDNNKDCESLIGYHLENPDIREKIAGKGLDEVFKNHQYLNRANKILSIIK